jgi:sugar phosphate isomerase/epimerase
MDTHDTRKRSLQEQALMLKELGYAGAGHLGLDQVEERQRTLDAAGLRLFQIYLRIDLTPGAKEAYDGRLKNVLPLLKGRDTTLAVLITGGRPSDESLDPRAVQVLREVADLASPHGLGIALYPHTADWLEKVEDAVRVARKTERKHVGVMFNLCHWLRTDPQRDYRRLLELAGPSLVAVSINGADDFDPQPGWQRYIQPLDAGSFNVRALVEALGDAGYQGPVGLQCYGLPGDAQDHLRRSMTTWRSWTQGESQRR